MLTPPAESEEEDPDKTHTAPEAPFCEQPDANVTLPLPASVALPLAT